MLHLLKRHPLPVVAFFRHSLVLTFAYPQKLLQPLVPPGLVLDTYKGFGFLAIAVAFALLALYFYLRRELARDKTIQKRRWR